MDFSLGSIVGGLLPFTTDNAGNISPEQQQALWAEHLDQLAREKQAYDAQQALAAGLRDVAYGRVQSLAGGQLTAGLGDILQGQAALAGGARGNAGALARYGAMQNAAGLGARLNQQQALAGMQERNTAMGQLGDVLGAQANESLQGYGTALGATANLANTAQRQRQEEQARQDKMLGGFLGGGGSSLAQGATGGGGLGSALGPGAIAAA
jgi:hypothetical protein